MLMHCCYFIFQPMRACVLGPPAAGKTTIVKALCDHYKLHHIHIKDVIAQAIEKLVSKFMHCIIQLKLLSVKVNEIHSLISYFERM